MFFCKRKKLVKGEEYGFFAQFRVNLAAVYIGGYFGYGQGDDLNTTEI
jgi:hypothetical protein